MELKRVVITGVGALTPIGNTYKDTCDALKAGKSGAAPITLFDPSKFKTQFACEVKDFDPTAHFDRKEARKLDRYSQFALVVADEAMADSGLVESSSFNPDRAGVIWGSGIGGISTFQEETLNFASGDGTPRFNPFFIPKMIADIAGGQISMKYNLRGPNFTTVSACASSTNSLIDAYNYIRLGMMDACVSGGSEAAISKSGIGGFNAMHALSTRNDSPQTASRPFDKDRDGFVLGEGAACLILEEYEHAKKRGATIYAEVIGGGMSADAHHITAPHPDGLGAKAVMESALKDAQIDSSAVDYINVHGTSTPLGDVAELKAIKAIFGDDAYNLNISSTKSMTGHLLGAAGALETLACVMAVRENIVPPTINHFTDDPAIDSKLNLTFGKPQEREVNVAISNTFGFGGHNASIVVRKLV